MLRRIRLTGGSGLSLFTLNRDGHCSVTVSCVQPDRRALEFYKVRLLSSIANSALSEDGSSERGLQQSVRPPKVSLGDHKDWRLLAVVGLFLLSTVVYLLTMDESWRPFSGSQQPGPSALDDGEEHGGSSLRPIRRSADGRTTAAHGAVRDDLIR